MKGCLEPTCGLLLPGEAMAAADGRLLIDHDGSHSGTVLSYFEADGKRRRFRQVGEPWLPPHAHGTSYHPTHAHP